MVRVCAPSSEQGRDDRISNSVPSWDTEQNQGQPGQYSETLAQNTKEKGIGVSLSVRTLAERGLGPRSDQRRQMNPLSWVPHLPVYKLF